MSNENKSKKAKRRHHKKHYVVTPYIKTPIIFVLIFMIAVVPILIAGMNFAVDKVHSAQKVLSISYNELDVKENNHDEVLDACEMVGKLSCDRVGLNTDVYYGINRVSLRNGCGLSTKGDTLQFGGNTLGAFKLVHKLVLGDIIVCTTDSGESMYQVVDISNKNNSDKLDAKCIVLCTSKDNSPFSYYDDEKLYVTAKEVLYE